jgi:hypothetical protein
LPKPVRSDARRVFASAQHEAGLSRFPSVHFTPESPPRAPAQTHPNQDATMTHHIHEFFITALPHSAPEAGTLRLAAGTAPASVAKS